MCKRFPPAGSNMNDEGYPFRGEYKMEPQLNHGHSGTVRKGSTSLMLRITGTNLAIEKLQPCRGQTLHCELGIDHGPQKKIVFPGGCGAVPVPSDGHEYNLTAVVQGASAKHYCKMVLCGGDEKTLIRLRAPDDFRLADAIVLQVDGEKIEPINGWYNIPVQAKECSLNIVERNFLKPFFIQKGVGASMGAPSSTAAPSTIILQSTAGVDENPVLLCSGSGESFRLSPNRPIAVVANSGPFTFQLPRVTPKSPHIAPRAYNISYPEPVGADSLAYRIPELETRIISPAEGDAAPPIFLATADGFTIELAGDDGASAVGHSSVQLYLPDRKEHRVRLTITDGTGRTFLRQNAVIPATEHPPLSFSISKDAHSNPVIVGKHSSQIIVDNLLPVRGDLGVPLDENVQHVVDVRDGGNSTSFQIGPPQISPPLVAQSAATVPPSTTSFKTEPWIERLARVVQCSDLNEARRELQCIIPPNSDATTIVGFVAEQLFKTPPTISFKKNIDGVTDIQCAGYSVTAAVDNAAPSFVPAGNGVHVGVGHSMTLSAVIPSSGRVAAACCMHLMPLMEENLDAELVARLLDTFQRHTNTPDAVVLELANVTSPLSVNGYRLLSLIRECLNRSSFGSQRPLQLIAGEAPENARLIIVADDKETRELLPGSSLGIMCNNKIHISLHGASSPVGKWQNEFAKNLVEFFYRESPPPLAVRWAGVPTNCREERDLLDLLLQLVRDRENESAQKQMQGVFPSAIDVLQFTCKGGCLQNVRTEKPCRLSVSVDGTGFMQLEQGGQVPQGYAFPSGSEHRVHIIARDVVSGAPCAEAKLILMGSESIDSTTRMTPQSSCFIDASLLQVSDEVHLRLLCPPKLRIVCDVDGGGGIGSDAWKTEFTAKMSAARSHDVNVRLLDDTGAVVFEQRFTLPALISSFWSVGLENSLLLVDDVPPHGDRSIVGQTALTASFDRSPERSLTGPLHFDSSNPHKVLLRRYITGPGSSKICAGELSLRVPAFIDPQYLQELSRLYQAGRPGGNRELRSQLNQLHSRVPSNILKELISALMEHLVLTPCSPQRSSSNDARIHFRLSGDESLLLPRYGSSSQSRH